MSNKRFMLPTPGPPPKGKIIYHVPLNCNCFPRECSGKDCEQLTFVPKCQPWTYSITCQEITVKAENNVNYSESCSQCYIKLHLCTLNLVSPNGFTFSFQFLSPTDQSTDGTFPLFNCEGNLIVNKENLWSTYFTTYQNLSEQPLNVYKCKQEQILYNTLYCNSEYWCEEAHEITRAEYLQVGNKEICSPESPCEDKFPKITKQENCNPSSETISCGQCKYPL